MGKASNNLSKNKDWCAWSHIDRIPYPSINWLPHISTWKRKYGNKQ